MAEIARGRDDDWQAAKAYREALHTYATIGERWLIILPLAGLADLAAAHGQGATAATLVGFLDGLAEQTGAPLLSAAHLTRERAARAAAALLDDPHFERQREVGRTTTLEAAVDLAASVTISDRPHRSVRGTITLTKRELEIFRLLARMHTDQDIATALSISRRTVSGHVAHILAKLDVETRRAAVFRGRELGLLDDARP
jgi:DNA-binding CsgD family transcriptional regulator